MLLVLLWQINNVILVSPEMGCVHTKFCENLLLGSKLTTGTHTHTDVHTCSQDGVLIRLIFSLRNEGRLRNNVTSYVP
jgi:hypothetical protein